MHIPTYQTDNNEGRCQLIRQEISKIIGENNSDLRIVVGQPRSKSVSSITTVIEVPATEHEESFPATIRDLARLLGITRPRENSPEWPGNNRWSISGARTMSNGELCVFYLVSAP